MRIVGGFEWYIFRALLEIYGMKPNMIYVLVPLFFVLGGVLAFWLEQRKKQKLLLDFEVLLERHKTCEEALAKAEDLRDALVAEKNELEKTVTRMQAESVALESRLNQTDAVLEKKEKELSELREDLAASREKWGRLESEIKEKERGFEKQMALLNESKALLKKEFENLANEILEQKGKAFKEMNSETISALLNPVREEMKGFRSKVEDLHEKDVEQRAKLTTELIQLQKLNQKITDQAERLTTALQGQKKVQGNWGELILENILESSGLRLGKDYKREVSFNTEEGRKRPDAIVYLPHGQHLVIDAKTSLAAYTKYVNAENEEERASSIAAHAQAVADRIAELSDRDYFKLPGIHSPEVVIMFIPIESAYVEALKYDETLFQRAIEQNILVATPTTLLTSLNIVRQLWRFEDQNKHAAELANQAEKFYNKLNGFLGSMQTVGKQLDNAKSSYEKAFGQLYSGRGNLIKQAARFKELGVSVQKELPEDLVERAQLELGEVALSEDSVDPAQKEEY